MMFPTRVGMNRLDEAGAGRGFHVPHTRGDEPQELAENLFFLACSPHAWG